MVSSCASCSAADSFSSPSRGGESRRMQARAPFFFFLESGVGEGCFCPSSPGGYSPPSLLDYSPVTPPRHAASPDYTPSTPRRRAASPYYTPSTPPRRAASPDYTPSTPPLRAASPAYTPSTPPRRAASPDYTPSTPPRRAASPDYTPSTPLLRAASPDYTPSTPPPRAASPDYSPSTPSASPVPSNAESGTSPVRRRRHPYQRRGSGIVCSSRAVRVAGGRHHRRALLYGY